MHLSAFDSGKAFFDLYCRQRGCRVLDVGAYNVNGTLRDCRRRDMDYTGADMAEGPGVDVVMTDPDKIPFGDDAFDAVVSTSTCEHAGHFWLLVLEMFRVVKPGGYIYINAPSNGTFHQYPFDYWRFYPDAGLAFAGWGRKNGYPASLVESGICAQGTEEWNDFFAVLQKSDEPVKARGFIALRAPGFFNVRLCDREDIVNHTPATEDQLKCRALQAELRELRSQLNRTEAKLRKARVARWLPRFLRPKDKDDSAELRWQ